MGTNLPVHPRQMFVNGDRAVRAKSEENPLWLKRDFVRDPNVLAINGVTNKIISGTLSVTDSNYFGINSWQNKSDIETVNFWNWVSERCLVDSIAGNMITEDAFCTENLISNYNRGNTIDRPQWIENAYELLNEENEWYYNKTDGYFYYKPVGSNLPNNLNIVTPQTEYLVNVKGNEASKIHDIKFDNLTFKYGAWSDINRVNIRDPGRNYLVIQAGVSKVNNLQPSQITSQYSENIVFNNVIIENMASGGIEFGVGAKNNKLLNSVVKNVSGNGVTIGSAGRYHTQESQTVGNVVYNNFVEKAGTEFDGIGVFLLYGNKNIIKHNEITNVPYSGMSICWGWTNMLQTQCYENIVEANKIHNTMHTLRDGAGIYLNGTQPNNIVKNNYLYNNPNDYGGYTQMMEVLLII